MHIIYSNITELGKPFLFVLNHLYCNRELIHSFQNDYETNHPPYKQGENKKKQKQTGFLLVK